MWYSWIFWISKIVLKSHIFNFTFNEITRPDYSDSFTYNKGNKRINLLHSRLSIIDLRQRSNQPFVIGSYVIIFNGEIYNFESLRKNLNIQKILNFQQIQIQKYY